MSKALKHDIEARWFKILWQSLKHFDAGKEYYNVTVMVPLLCMTEIVLIRFVVKYFIIPCVEERTKLNTTIASYKCAHKCDRLFPITCHCMNHCSYIFVN